MKRVLSLLLSLVLLITLLPPKSLATNQAVKMSNGEPIIFTVANDALQELKYSTIPIVRNNKYYIPLY